VWPALYLSGRYTASYSTAPYIGGGLGLYKVLDYESMTTSENVPAVHVFLGVEFFHQRFTHIDLEVRYERTANASKVNRQFNDGGELGGLLISGGISW
jgi:hypothetical protein